MYNDSCFGLYCDIDLWYVGIGIFVWESSGGLAYGILISYVLYLVFGIRYCFGYLFDNFIFSRNLILKYLKLIQILMEIVYEIFAYIFTYEGFFYYLGYTTLFY